MNEELKKKARTLSELIDEILDWDALKLTAVQLDNFNLKSDPFLVRLSDAEQEIDNWIDAYNKLNDSYQKEIKQVEAKLAKAILRYQDYDHERLELKQKLRQRYDECKRIEETTASPLWREGARWNMKLIEELSKEKNEAKP